MAESTAQKHDPGAGPADNEASTEEPSAARELDWSATGWSAQREWALDRWLAASPTQRLAWLEEAIELAWSVGALPRATPAPRPQHEPSAGR